MSQKISQPPVTFDRRSFSINGKRTLLISGEIHFSRALRKDWAHILDQTVSLGVNTVAAYVFWNFHELKKDQFDFSGDRDLGYFLKLCQERGLYVILRTGPYCCGEWNYGGFPAWLRDEPGMVFRTFNQPFMDRVAIYFKRLFSEFCPYLATKGGPVILVQVENEYGNVGKWYGAEGEKYTKWIVELASSLGVDVPTITCQGGTPGAIECVNGFTISDEKIYNLRARQPNAPLVWTELWPGWYNTWGHAHHYRDDRNIAYHILSFISRGGSGFNYYMWYAGTNLGRTAMFQQCTDYDMDTPLDEYGEARIKGLYLKLLHKALKECEIWILEGEVTSSQNDHVEKISFKTPSGQAVITLDHISEVKVADHVMIPSAKIELNNILLFDSIIDFNRCVSSAPSNTWKTVEKLTPINCCNEPLPESRIDPSVHSHSPMEQLKLTEDRSDYCWYSTIVKLGNNCNHHLKVTYGADILYCFVDGKFRGMTKTPLREWRGVTTRETDRKPQDSDDREWAAEAEQFINDGYVHEFNFAESAGLHRVDILATSIGLVKGDWSISGPMTTECKGIWDEVLLNGLVIDDWEMKPFLAEECHAPSKVNWRNLPEIPERMSWYRFAIDLSQKELTESKCWRIDLAGWGKGMAFVNDHMIGRYWLLNAQGYGPDDVWHPKDAGLYIEGDGSPTQQYYLIPSSWLHEGNNEIVLFEEQLPGKKVAMECRMNKLEQT